MTVFLVILRRTSSATRKGFRLRRSRLAGRRAAGDCRAPVVQAGFSAKEIFGGLPRFLDGFRRQVVARGRATSRGGFRLASFWVCNVRYAHTHGLTPMARLSVIPFASRTPLPPSISLRSLRSLRLKILRRAKMPAIQRGEWAFHVLKIFWKRPLCFDSKLSRRKATASRRTPN